MPFLFIIWNKYQKLKGNHKLYDFIMIDCESMQIKISEGSPSPHLQKLQYNQFSYFLRDLSWAQFHRPVVATNIVQRWPEIIQNMEIGQYGPTQESGGLATKFKNRCSTYNISLQGTHDFTIVVYTMIICFGEKVVSQQENPLKYSENDIFRTFFQNKLQSAPTRKNFSNRYTHIPHNTFLESNSLEQSCS